MNELNPAPWPVGNAPEASLCADDARLSVLAGYGVDALQADPELQRIADFAARLCETPIALVSIVEQERQRFLVAQGYDGSETPRSQSFCAHAMLRGRPMIVPDATRDPLFAGNPLVTGDPGIRFYAGAPLITSEGAPIGALCVIDGQPRDGGLDDLQLEGLQVLAQSVMRRLEGQRLASKSEERITEALDRVTTMINSVPDIAWGASADLEFDQYNAQWHKVTGAPPPKSVEEWGNFIHPEDFQATSEKFIDHTSRAEPFEDEWRLKQADGTWRWTLSRAVPSSSDPATARWFGTLTDIDEGHRLSQSHEVIAKELSHRIKNIFAVISGLVVLRARNQPEVKEFAAELGDAIRALGRAHDFVRPLKSEKSSRVRDLISVLMAPYGVAEDNQVDVEGPEITLGRRAATPLALIFHELATNSAKYGALSREDGRVMIQLERHDGSVTIRWSETGAPVEGPPEREGFGSQLLEMSVRSQLDGSIERSWDGEGLMVELRIPAASLAL